MYNMLIITICNSLRVYRFLSRLKSDEDHNKCDQYHYVQLFKKTYFLIETSDADLEVGYEFVGKIFITQIDYKWD